MIRIRSETRKQYFWRSSTHNVNLSKCSLLNLSPRWESGAVQFLLSSSVKSYICDAFDRLGDVTPILVSLFPWCKWVISPYPQKLVFWPFWCWNHQGIGEISIWCVFLLEGCISLPSYKKNSIDPVIKFLPVIYPTVSSTNVPHPATADGIHLVFLLLRNGSQFIWKLSNCVCHYWDRLYEVR